MNKPRLEAIKMLTKARAGEVELTAAQWFDLTLLETGSRELAQAAHTAYVKGMYRAGRTPE